MGSFDVADLEEELVRSAELEGGSDNHSRTSGERRQQTPKPEEAGLKISDKGWRRCSMRATRSKKIPWYLSKTTFIKKDVNKRL